MYGYIYKTTNLVNNKIYFGQHKGQFTSNYFGSSKSLKRDILENKHSFKLEVVVYAEDNQKLNELERQYIKEYWKMFGRDNSYNITEGGGGCGGCTRSPETRKKIGIANLGKKLTPEHKEKIKLSLIGKNLGENNPAKRPEVREKNRLAHIGRKHSPEHIEKIRISAKFGNDNPAKRPEVRQKIREKSIGENNPMFGKKHTKETKEKIRLSVKRSRSMV